MSLYSASAVMVPPAPRRREESPAPLWISHPRLANGVHQARSKNHVARSYGAGTPGKEKTAYAHKKCHQPIPLSTSFPCPSRHSTYRTTAATSAPTNDTAKPPSRSPLS